MIISYTGHRPNPKLGGYKVPNPIYNYVTNELRRILQELKPDKAISGMALGFDQYAAWVCVELGIPFVTAVPFVGQEKAWPQSSQDEYHRLLALASEVVVVCEGGYAPYKMQVRNEYLVDNCDILVGCFDQSPGGTYNCIEYARSKNKDIRIIDPRLYNAHKM